MNDGTDPVPRGSLCLVGTGIRAISQVTPEARDRLAAADIVHYLVADPITERWLGEINPGSRSLTDCYMLGGSRRVAYQRMVDRIVADVAGGSDVVVAFYGHPGVFARPGHDSIEWALASGYAAEMLPGISSEDCLFADLGIDPSARGCQSYEATDFLLHPKLVDTSALLVLWQVGLVGDLSFTPAAAGAHSEVLAGRLLQLYQPDHEVTLYEAAHFQVARPRIQRCALRELGLAEMTTASTLVVPPGSPRRVDHSAYDLFGLSPPT